MKNETLFAWTSVGDYRYYPQFINVSRNGGRIVVSVRSLEDTTGEHPRTGAHATVTLPDEVVAKLAAALASRDPEAAKLIEQLVREGSAVMRLLEEHGPSIVPHLLDTDDNAGQRFRDALLDAALGAANTPEQQT
jgi:hypothetical protein